MLSWAALNNVYNFGYYMELDIKYFKDFDRIKWDECIEQLPFSTYKNSWDVINYFSQFPDILGNYSFIAFLENKPVGVCSIGLSCLPESNKNEFSFNGSSCTVPALANFKPSMRRKLSDEIYRIIYNCATENNVQLIKMESHPLTRSCCANNKIDSDYLFEPLRYQMIYNITNTLIIDLMLDEDVLLQNVSKYHRKHIHKGGKFGLKVKVFNNKYNPNQLDEKCHEYQLVHLAAAGRVTRPQETWDAMLMAALHGKATLFIAYVEDKPISYLFCGEFHSMAFGWSQANVEEYEKTYPSRHLLEWKAILYYKKHGVSFYEVGERFFGPQLYYLPTAKEVTISVFKERYGGYLYPKVSWYGYLDAEYIKHDLTKKLSKFLDEYAIFKPPITEM